MPTAQVHTEVFATLDAAKAAGDLAAEASEAEQAEAQELMAKLQAMESEVRQAAEVL